MILCITMLEWITSWKWPMRSNKILRPLKVLTTHPRQEHYRVPQHMGEDGSNCLNEKVSKLYYPQKAITQIHYQPFPRNHPTSMSVLSCCWWKSVSSNRSPNDNVLKTFCGTLKKVSWSTTTFDQSHWALSSGVLIFPIRPNVVCHICADHVQLWDDYVCKLGKSTAHRHLKSPRSLSVRPLQLDTFQGDGHIWGLEFTRYVRFSFRGNQTMFSWDIANSIFGLE